MLNRNKEWILKIEKGIQHAKRGLERRLIKEPFLKDFSLRFCWSSNAIEGNTLSLEETVSFIEYDEVRSGHTYTEYEEAKRLYYAITSLLLPMQKKESTEEWIQCANGFICGEKKEYRQMNVCIGNLMEAMYYPPSFEQVPKQMKEYLQMSNFSAKDVEESICKIAENHIRFERIHPFVDGNGRTGRIILNQQLINCGLLPVTIRPNEKYRQAFQLYKKNRDVSMMIHVICKAELEAIERVEILMQKERKQEYL